MIGALTIAILVLAQVVSIVLSCVALWVACQAMLTKSPSLWTILKCGLQIAGLGLAVSLVTLGAAAVSEWAGLIGIPSFMVLLIILVRMFRKSFDIGGPTAVGVTILFLILHGGAELGFGYIVHRFVVEGFRASSESMSPTFQPGDRFFALKWKRLARWRIVVYRVTPSVANVSRVVGLPGERVEIDSKGLLINGARVTPPRGVPAPHPGQPGAHALAGSPAQLTADEYFIVSDNSERSLDSRSFGTRWFPTTLAGATHPWGLPDDEVVGVVGVRYWPLSRFRILE